MDNKIKYQRSFLIFSSEDTGYGSGQEPSGYVKTEINNGKGKLTASVQNLKEIGRLDYKLYILRYTADKLTAVYVGPVKLQRNRAEIKWDFTPENVSNTGLHIGEFNIAAVVGQSKEGQGNELVCPMAAYKDTKYNWRSKIREAMKPAGPDAAKVYVASGNTENKVEPAAARVNEDRTPGFEPVPEEEIDAGEEIVSKYDLELESRYTPSPDEPNLENIYEPVRAEEQDTREIDRPEETIENKIEAPEETRTVESPDRMTQAAEPEQEEHRRAPEEPRDKKGGPGFDEFMEMARSLGLNNVSDQNKIKPAAHTHLNTGFCTPNNSSPTSPCNTCAMNSTNKKAPADTSKEGGDIESLRIYFDKYFESYDPFRSRRKDYQWWKVGSPVQLNNIMYQCNLKTPLLFNPAVMMSHFKYRHLIVGIYSDRIRKREYIVCGVPGVYRVDDRPFGDLCRWVQIEGNKPRYGAFGYWLVYIDGKSGKLLNVN